MNGGGDVFALKDGICDVELHWNNRPPLLPNEDENARTNDRRVKIEDNIMAIVVVGLHFTCTIIFCMQLSD